MSAAETPPAESWMRTRDVLVPEGPEDFGSLLLSAPVLEGLKAAGFLRPSPVQLKAIPLGRCGLDLIVQAKSGTGKTCVFSTVALDSLVLESPVTQILILAPTREIAVQIHAVITTIGIKMEGLECHVFIGGTPLNQDKIRLKKCHIAVGSPGRIKQLIELDYLNTASIRLFILDEADKLLEEGSFQEQVNWIYSSLPANKQMLAVSATYPESLASTLSRYMRDPTFVQLNPTDPSLIGLKQYFKVVNSHPLPHKTFEEKVEHLQELFSKIPFNQALVFSNLHSRAQHLAEILTSKGFPAECISGSMNQNQRLDAMAKLKQFHCRVLISTDLTSRGIDAEKVNLVINLDVPLDWETYMHRIGRAGRFGTLGLAVTYCCRGEEETMMMKIAQKCNLRLLPLPEPIPPELMDQFEGWDVEVTAVPYPNASLHSSLLPAKKPEGTGQNKAASTSVQSCPVVACEKPAVKSKQDLGQKKSLKSRTGHAKAKTAPRNPQPSHSPPQQKCQMESDLQMAGQHHKLEQEQEALRSMLPKIPCLSSFKNQQSASTWNIAELIEDYKYFIKEGLEREVEVVRSYSGGGEQHQHPESDALDCTRTRSRSPATIDASTGELDSDSGSCSSGASTCSEEDQLYLQASSATQQRDHSELPRKETFQTRPRMSSSSPKQEKFQEKFQEAPLFPKKTKPDMKQDKLSHQPCPFKPCKGETIEDATVDNHEDQSYEDYWKAYYWAWQDYYVASSHSYYQMYRKWLNQYNAYHANEVYFQELLKGGQ